MKLPVPVKRGGDRAAGRLHRYLPMVDVPKMYMREPELFTLHAEVGAVQVESGCTALGFSA